MLKRIQQLLSSVKQLKSVRFLSLDQNKIPSNQTPFAMIGYRNTNYQKLLHGNQHKFNRQFIAAIVIDIQRDDIDITERNLGILKKIQRALISDQNITINNTYTVYPQSNLISFVLIFDFKQQDVDRFIKPYKQLKQVVFNKNQLNIELSTIEQDTTIYYKLDKDNWSQYKQQISLTENNTYIIQAYSTKQNYINSKIKKETFIV